MQSTGVKLVFLDTVSVEEGKNGAEEMVAMVGAELASSHTSDWRIVIGDYIDTVHLYL